MCRKGCYKVDLDHERRLTVVESRSKSNTKRLDDVEKKQDDLAELVGTVKLLADREKRVEDDVKEIKESVNEIKDKPGKRWEGVVDKIIFTVIGGIITFLLFKLGIGG